MVFGAIDLHMRHTHPKTVFTMKCVVWQLL